MIGKIKSFVKALATFPFKLVTPTEYKVGHKKGLDPAQKALRASAGSVQQFYSRVKDSGVSNVSDALTDAQNMNQHFQNAMNAQLGNVAEEGDQTSAGYKRLEEFQQTYKNLVGKVVNKVEDGNRQLNEALNPSAAQETTVEGISAGTWHTTFTKLQEARANEFKAVEAKHISDFKTFVEELKEPEFKEAFGQDATREVVIENGTTDIKTAYSDIRSDMDALAARKEQERNKLGYNEKELNEAYILSLMPRKAMREAAEKQLKNELGDKAGAYSDADIESKMQRLRLDQISEFDLKDEKYGKIIRVSTTADGGLSVSFKGAASPEVIERKIEKLIAVAKAKGWKTINFQATKAFSSGTYNDRLQRKKLEMAYKKAVQAGLGVTCSRPTGGGGMERMRMSAEIKKEAESLRAKQMTANQQFSDYYNNNYASSKVGEHQALYKRISESLGKSVVSEHSTPKAPSA